MFKDLPVKMFGEEKKIRGISFHSQQTKPGDLFVAINGFSTSGKNYIEQAIQNGAVAIATDDAGLISKIVEKYNVTGVYTDNPRRFLAIVANRFFDFPSKKIKLIGITGTNGKTTTSYLIKSIIEQWGEKVGLTGTISYFDGSKWIPATNTTPESLDLVSFLANLVSKNIKYCVSEVSSHALALERTYGLDFAVAIFTNLTSDHLDFHGSKQAYGAAKLKLFESLDTEAYAIINLDDSFSKEIINSTKAKVVGYSLKNKHSDFYAEIVSTNETGTEIIINSGQNQVPNKSQSLRIHTKLIGEHNIYNVLASIATAKVLKIPDEAIVKGIENIKFIPGRLEKIESEQGFTVYIDYAHTEDALLVVIQSLRNITQGRLIVVFGCGGNRDCLKRPAMGKVTTELADFVIVTSDNPRNEDPMKIIEDIKKGIKKNNYEVIVDREMAISRALSLAKKDDVILIAGKGHENYQIIRDKILPFSDKEVVEKMLKAKRNAQNLL